MVFWSTRHGKQVAFGVKFRGTDAKPMAWTPPEANLSLNGGQPQEQQQNGGVHESYGARTTAGAGQFNELTISGDQAKNAKIPSLVR
jgi:hypothetical protein